MVYPCTMLRNVTSWTAAAGTTGRGTAALLLVALLTGPAGQAAAQSAATELIEPHSGTPFPVSLVPPGASTAQQLTGTALRAVTVLFFSVPVYAFGIYVDADHARASLSEFAQRSAEELAGDEPFYRRLLDQEFAMTLRLVMVRDVPVSGEDMANAFDSSLRPRVEPAAAGEPGALQALERFRGYFDMQVIETGAEFVFACTPEAVMTTSIDGDEQPPIESPALCRALFDVYLGADPISAEGKQTVIARFPDLLAAPR